MQCEAFFATENFYCLSTYFKIEKAKPTNISWVQTN